MAPRPRKRGNRDMPPGLYATSSGFEYRHPVTKKRHGMGTDRAKAIAAANILNHRLKPSGDLVSRVVGAESVATVVERYRAEYLTDKRQAERTAKEREYRLNRIIADLGELALESLTVRRLADFLQPLAREAYIKHRQELVEIFRFACAAGIADRNLAELTLPKGSKAKTRKRWTQEQYDATLAVAEPWLRNAMALAVITLQRREDLCAMRHSHIEAGRLLVRQSKAENYETPVNLAISIWPELQACIDVSKQLTPFCPFLIGRKPTRDRRGKNEAKTHPFQVLPDYLSKALAAARDDCGLFDDVPAAERPTLHELRAFGAWLYREAGKPEEWVQALLGHASEKMTKHYLSGHAEEWVEIA
ncbi:tyrosine-type recombinase/integrase [Permianibacter sp. IMCC34836]|uniref:phage integrase Arm DNA-binding domain-containing protein n=1 Tax=Permianibacter fluminis TaxID=2738515 RepID=UPI0015540EC6|nr:phage integrase Arm DNA-binding domain-containing protein [Permianibacter fluminis]NQD37435.1 tyrosine-type recombinase/integrase [Permianibacter fluminis]